MRIWWIKVYWIYFKSIEYTMCIQYIHMVYSSVLEISNRNTLFSYFQFWATEFLFILHCWRQLSHGLPAWSTLEQMVSLIWWFSAAERRVGGRHVLEIRFLNCISKYIMIQKEEGNTFIVTQAHVCLQFCVWVNVWVNVWVFEGRMSRKYSPPHSSLELGSDPL